MTIDDLALVDEVLQVMYWMNGEGLGSEVESRDVMRFVAIDETRLERLFETLTSRGWLEQKEAGGAPRYALTDEGRREAARRFADEFADMTKPGHGECGDPDCECHRTGSAADCRHRQEAP
jgi:DNA-binding PadR family transcriptional regulator